MASAVPTPQLNKDYSPSQAHHFQPCSTQPGFSASANNDGKDSVLAGPDVTPTSPVPSVSVSLRPMASPGLYQPSLSVPEQEAPRPQPPSFPSAVSLTDSSTTEVSSSKSIPNNGVPEPALTVKHKENTGRWLAEEHEIFLQGLNEHGKQWKKIAVMIKTRSVVQVRTHAQKYFQKLLKSEKKDNGKVSVSTSTAVSNGMPSVAVKRKSSIKGNKTTASGSTAAKKRRVSLEPKVKKQSLFLPQQPSVVIMPSIPSPAPVDSNAIDPNFMNTLNMTEGDLDDSLLDLLDDSSVDAVEQVIGTDDDDLEPNPVETNPVSPSVSSVSLAENGSSGAVIEPVVSGSNRHGIVSSPNPEDFSIHNTIGTSAISEQEMSPTSVACMMDIKDFEHKTNSYNVDSALDWLMDVGVHQLPASSEETEEDWGNGYVTQVSIPAPVAVPKLPLTQKIAQVDANALSSLEGDVF